VFRFSVKLITLLVLFAVVLVAQQPASETRHHLTLWYLSALTLAGSSALDLTTSFGHKYETNPLLRGPNQEISGSRAIAIKFSPALSWLIAQRLLLRHHGRLGRVFEICNFASASVFGAAAAHNTTVPLH
jgi:hypothetical protein